MTEEAVRVQAVLSDRVGKTETEIALDAGISLVETRRALDELSLLGAVDHRVAPPPRVWRLGVYRDGYPGDSE